MQLTIPVQGNDQLRQLTHHCGSSLCVVVLAGLQGSTGVSGLVLAVQMNQASVKGAQLLRQSAWQYGCKLLATVLADSKAAGSKVKAQSCS